MPVYVGARRAVANVLPPVIIDSSAVPYLGPVTNGRTRMADQVHATNKQAMCRTYHELTDTITGIQLVYWNGYLNGVNEAGTGGTAQVSASILPSDLSSRIQVTFGGSPVGNVANNALIFSDMMPIAGVEAAKIFIDNWWASVGSLPYTNMCDTANGEMTTIGPTVADTTMSTWSGGGGTSVRPIAILGMTTKGTLVLFGDSISVGTAGNISQIVQGVRAGSIMPSLPGVGVIHLGRFGHRLNGLVASNTIQRQFLDYVTGAIVQLGINDTTADRTFAQMQADMETIRGWKPGLRWWAATTTPAASSTNNYIDYVNQVVYDTAGSGTPNTTREGHRQSRNAWVLSVPAGWFGAIDVAAAAEEPGKTGKWYSTGVAGYPTADRVHPSSGMYNRIRDAALITPAQVLARAA